MPIDANMETVINEHSELKARVGELRSAISGQLSDRNRVIDHLLDLRLESESPGLVATIDELLADVPGLTVVENTWWVGALDKLEAAAAPTVV